jgi:hypothetical protein
VPNHNKAFATVAANRFLLDGSPETETHDSLEVRDNDIVVRKTRFGAFSTTDLYAILHSQGIDTLVVAGTPRAVSFFRLCATLLTRITGSTFFPTLRLTTISKSTVSLPRRSFRTKPTSSPPRTCVR